MMPACSSVRSLPSRAAAEDWPTEPVGLPLACPPRAGGDGDGGGWASSGCGGVLPGVVEAGSVGNHEIFSRVCRLTCHGIAEH